MRVESTTFKSGGKRLKGNLHLPSSENPPCVVSLHGLESSKDSGKWPVLASSLCEDGFASFRFSFRGCGDGFEKSEGDFEETSLTERIKDYHAAIRFLEGTSKVNVDRLGVVGSSFGGMVAVASQNMKPKAMVTLATPYTLYHSVNLQLKTEEKHYVLPSGRRLKEKFFEDLRKYDLLKALGSVPPILIIHGSKDKLVPVEHAHKLYEHAEIPKELEVIEGADHTFSQAKHLDKVVNLSLKWFRKHLDWKM